MGIVSRADGSSFFSQGQTCVIVAVHGPRIFKTINKDQTLTSVKIVVRHTSEFAGSCCAKLESVLNLTLCSFIAKTIHPRTAIHIIVQVISDDGSVCSCAINAACIALIDAGIVLPFIFTSISVAKQNIFSTHSDFIIDPNAFEEESCSTACFVFSFQSKLNSTYIQDNWDYLAEEPGLISCSTHGIFNQNR